VKWFIEHAFVLVPAQSIVAEHLASSVEQVMEKLRNPPSNN
jgi:arylsulfatase